MSKNQKLTPSAIVRMLNEHKQDMHKYGVRRIGLFGSFLKKGNARKNDIDFLVAFEKPTFDNYIELKFMLQKMFHKKVDLVMEDSLKPALQYVKREALYA